MMADAVLAWLAQENHTLENLSFIATVVGVPLLLASYLASLAAEAHRREVGTYDTLETQYVEFQKLALLYPKLDVGDCPAEHPATLIDQELAQQRTLYMVLFSLFERAYLMYRPTFLGGLFGRAFMGRTRLLQWRGWVHYMERYLSRESCRAAWLNGAAANEAPKHDFDDNFEGFVNALMKRKGWIS